MDEEVRTLVHRLAADPRDQRTGAALARALARAEGSPAGVVEPVAIPPELGPGALALVVRPARPRPLFAWPEGADAAIGQTGRVRGIASDRLTCEIEVPGVGRFHAGAASLYPVPDLRGDGPRDAATFAEPLRAGPTALGALGADGLTDVQRALLHAIREDAPLPMGEVGSQAGFVAENNREAKAAGPVFRTLWLWRPLPPGLTLALVRETLPDLLGGEVADGESSPWTAEDVWVSLAVDPRKLCAGLPWALVAGVRTGEVATPPHHPREVSAALLLLLERPEAALDDVLRVLPGPDYGTGHRGDPVALRRIYETGAGSSSVRTSFEIVLPLTILVTVPEPDVEPSEVALVEAIESAVRASRVEGVDGVRRGRGVIHVQAERGQDLLALRRQLENLLPREREVHYRLPMPLVPWLRAFLDDRRKAGVSDADLRRAILAARPPGPSGRGRARG